MDIYARAQKAGRLSSFLYEASGNLYYGICAIHRGDFGSAQWYLAMGGFCPWDDGINAGQIVAVDEERIEDDMARYAYPTVNGQGMFRWAE